jgi:putative Holliday junction resolvase
MHETPNIKDIDRKHIMAIDYGRKFTGYSLYKFNIDPFPLASGRVAYSDDIKLIKDIKYLIEEEFVDFLVMGIPYFTDGSESKQTKEMLVFSKELQNNVNIPLYTVDETLTTYEAKERMMNDPRYNFKVDINKIDAVCASIIMEEFIKNTKRNEC